MTKALYTAGGSLRVTQTRGFWFSGGGVKGSFGYYPHLKDSHGCPVYPDTQVRGDLRAATVWLEEGIGNQKIGDNDKLFPTRGEQGSLLYLTDLSLADPAQWKKEWWTRKPRIEINDDTSTVEQNMLALKEKAWHNGHELQTRLFLHYVSGEEDLKSIMRRLAGAVPLLGGIGAERSRMLYAGKFSLGWDKEVTRIEVPESFSAEPFSEVIALRSLVHFRNRVLTGEISSHVQCLPYITRDQIRGWFAQAYHLCFDTWPTPGQMNCIGFRECYPALEENGIVRLAYPPSANTTERDGVVSDETGRNPGEEDSGQFLSKPSSLPRGSFVTDEPHPRIVRVAIERRMRNAMAENFKTRDQGLFVQEFIPRGTLFAGRVSCNGDKEYNGKARFILENIRPWISRCLFDAKLVPDTADEPVSRNDRPHALVVHAAPYLDVLKETKAANQLTVTSTKGYAAHLGRPRRNRITISPGSVINAPEARAALTSSLVAWKGFGKTFQHEVKTESPYKGAATQDQPKPEGRITRSQEGILRSFLHPKTTTEHLGRWLDETVAKGAEGKSGIPNEKLKEIKSHLIAHGLKDAQTSIKDYLTSMRKGRWDARREDLRKTVEEEKEQIRVEREKRKGSGE